MTDRFRLTLIDNTPAARCNPKIIATGLLRRSGIAIESVSPGLSKDGYDLNNYCAILGDREAGQLLREVEKSPIYQALFEADTFGFREDEIPEVVLSLDEPIKTRVVAYGYSIKGQHEAEMAELMEPRDRMLADYYRQSASRYRNLSQEALSKIGHTNLSFSDVQSLLIPQVQ